MPEPVILAPGTGTPLSRAMLCHNCEYVSDARAGYTECPKCGSAQLWALAGLLDRRTARWSTLP